MVDFVLENVSFDVESSSEAIDETCLKALDAKLGVPLPSQLRSYYSRWNGGLPIPSNIPMNKSAWVRIFWKPGTPAASVGVATAFEGLYKIDSTDPGTDFYETWKDFKSHLPQDTLCFARDPGGSQFLIGTQAHNLGKIYFWERSYQADIANGEQPSYDNIADVANSFVEFLLALREEPNAGESLEAWVKRVYP